LGKKKLVGSIKISRRNFGISKNINSALDEGWFMFKKRRMQGAGKGFWQKPFKFLGRF